MLNLLPFRLFGKRGAAPLIAVGRLGGRRAGLSGTGCIVGRTVACGRLRPAELVYCDRRIGCGRSLVASLAAMRDMPVLAAATAVSSAAECFANRGISCRYVSWLHGTRHHRNADG